MLRCYRRCHDDFLWLLNSQGTDSGEHRGPGGEAVIDDDGGASGDWYRGPAFSIYALTTLNLLLRLRGAWAIALSEVVSVR